MVADGGCERDMLHRINEGYSAWGVLSNRGTGINTKKCLDEIVNVPTFGGEVWGMRSAERGKVNVLEMGCLRSLVGVSRMDKIRNYEVRMRAGIEREFVGTADQRVLRCFGHVEIMDEYRMARRAG